MPPLLNPIIYLHQNFFHRFAWFIVVKERKFFVGGTLQQVVVDANLVGDAFFFAGKEPENAKMAAVITDVFRHLVEGLSEVNHAAMSVSAVDEIIDESVLVALANQVIKHDNFLVVHRQLFEREDFTAGGLNDLITNIGVDVFSKVPQKSLVFVLVQVFGKKENFVELQQLVKHVQ